jgi:hypothetical protein
MGAKYQSRGDIASAEKYYSDALRLDPSLLKVRIKRFLLSLGKMGDFLRRSLARLTLAG